MFIQVKLLKGFQKILTYKIPEGINNGNLVGKIVRVPIRNQETSAIVLHQFTQPTTKTSFKIREIKYIEPFPEDNDYNPFIAQLGRYYQIDTLHFLKRIRSFLGQKETSDLIPSHIVKPPKKSEKKSKNNNIHLTAEQQKVCTFLSNYLENQSYRPTVLHGVTGSGKTEIYKKIIIETIEKGKTSLLLLPEVTLAIQFEKLMREQLPQDIVVCSFHSGTTIKNKKAMWQYLIKQKPILIIGVHLPVLLPIANLGSIIIDEEHESGYQEKKHPKLNTKDAAILRAYQYNIPILLGSATPSLSTLFNVKTKGWNFFQLKKRFAGTFPEIKTVYLNDKKCRRNFWISQNLEDEIRDRLSKKQQAIIFLNRRGFSFFVQCKKCDFIFSCPNCSVSLTLHKNHILTCHYCSHTITHPQVCPTCKDKHKKFIKKGIGTQQVVTILEKIFPHARIGRADLDTTTKKKIWQKTINEFENGTIDILVGTQTITKGFHFPRVTLVGILWADLHLHFPIFNATETTLQQLIQVAGRAGRNNIKSKVIVQTMHDHPVFKFLDEVNYLKFYEYEIQKRKELRYPPYSRLVEIELKHTHEPDIEKEAVMLATYLMDQLKQQADTMQLLGPANPPVSKIKNTHMRKIYIKGNNIHLIGKLFQTIDRTKYKSKIFFTPNPAN